MEKVSGRETLKQVQAAMASVILKTVAAQVEVTFIGNGHFSVFAETQDDLDRSVELLRQVPGVTIGEQVAFPEENNFCAFCVESDGR